MRDDDTAPESPEQFPWDRITVTATTCKVDRSICAAIDGLVGDGCTVPFICRYRAGAVNSAPAETVRRVATQLSDLKLLQKKVMNFVSSNERKKQTLSSLRREGRRDSDAEVIAVRRQIMPDELLERLYLVIKMEDLEYATAPFRVTARKTIIDTALEAGLEPVIQSLMSGNGGALCYRSNLEVIAPKIRSLYCSDADLEKALIAVLANVMSKDPASLQLTDKYFNPQYCYVNSKVRRRSYSTDGSSSSPRRPKSVESASAITQSLSGNHCDRTRELGNGQDDELQKFHKYFNFHRRTAMIHGFQTLAIDRGEAKKFLQVSIEFGESFLQRLFEGLRRSAIGSGLAKTEQQAAHMERQSEHCFNGRRLLLDLVNRVIHVTWTKYLKPALSRRVRKDLTTRATEEALDSFAENLKILLLTAPVKVSSKGTVMAIDPGFAHGCKTAVIAPSTSEVLWLHVLPLLTTRRPEAVEARAMLKAVIQRFSVEVIGIGDGRGSAECQEAVAEIVEEINQQSQNVVDGPLCEDVPMVEPGTQVGFTIVRESGVSVWSVTEDAEREFPTLVPGLRSAVSLARRMVDPLSEMTRINPQHLGVGMYQHDIPKKLLETRLQGVLEDCVSLVGLDLNIAPVYMLKYIAGIGDVLAQRICELRSSCKEGFTDRMQLMDVPSIGPKTFEQCAGFLRIRGAKAKNPLDSTAIHPNDYPLTYNILKRMGLPLNCFGTANFRETFREATAQVGGVENLGKLFNAEMDSIKIIHHCCTQEEGFIKVNYLSTHFMRNQAINIKELKPKTCIGGIVKNVAPWGLFIDIGLPKEVLAPAATGAVDFQCTHSEFIRHFHVQQQVLVEIVENPNIATASNKDGTRRFPPHASGSDLLPITVRIVELPTTESCGLR